MSQIDSSETVSLGDEVVTAGIELAGGIRSPYPKGLLIGQVIDVQRDANSVVQTAFLQPTGNLEKLEYVLVVLDYQGGLPPIEQQPVDRGAPNGTLPQGEQPCLTAAPPASSSVAPSKAPLIRGRCLFAAMKGIVLAGGTATRLFPLTIVTNKHLLPIYDRPMIYYPIETLAGMGIREVMVIVGGKSVGDVVELLADGSHFGLDLTYRYQRGALGIAHAIGLARDFVGDDAFCCVLGDNILRGPAPCRRRQRLRNRAVRRWHNAVPGAGSGALRCRGVRSPPAGSSASREALTSEERPRFRRSGSTSCGPTPST